MSGVINDYESVAKFRQDLQYAVEDLRAQLKSTEQSIEKVSESWKDVQFEKFARDFEKDKDLIAPLCDVIEDFETDFLSKLERILREYIEQ